MLLAFVFVRVISKRPHKAATPNCVPHEIEELGIPPAQTVFHNVCSGAHRALLVFV